MNDEYSGCGPEVGCGVVFLFLLVAVISGAWALIPIVAAGVFALWIVIVAFIAVLEGLVNLFKSGSE